jgi:GrpB-like predicted nucleotidyltransferase (UPF0157 family)
MVYSSRVILSLYDPEWPVWFAQLRRLIAGRLGIPESTIHHVGSTAVPGLIAKPVIDMDIEIPSYDGFPAVSAGLRDLGYEDRGDLGIKDRIAFDRRDSMVPYCAPRRGWIDHHLYVCPSESRELKRHLAFRNILMKNPKAREAYSELKKALEIEAKGERAAYVALKEERARAFIENLIEGKP